jgi:hypothetical protein
MNACSRPGLAAHALYQYAKGGTDITGPSIRMAEAIAQNWGNLDFGFREVSQANGESTVEAYAWDLETNVRQTKVFQVPHIRHTKAGAYPVKDPREVYEMIANQAARRVRACILGIIPGDVIEQAVTQCESTLKTSTPVTPEQVKKMVESFATKGVTKSQIEKRIQRSLDAITPAQMVSLRKIFNSLNDGMSAPADWFDAEAPKATGKKHTLKEALTPPADREPGEEG